MIFLCTVDLWPWRDRVLACSGLGWINGIGVHTYGGYCFLKHITYIHKCGIYICSIKTKYSDFQLAELCNPTLDAGRARAGVRKACVDKFMTLL